MSSNPMDFEEDGTRYERDQRSASPRQTRDDIDSGRRRSASPNTNMDPPPIKDDGGSRDDGEGDVDGDGSINPGSNLFVTGIHPRLSEAEVTRLFEKYGEVEKCQIMKDPHTKESRGFGFVKMVTSDQADAARDGLQGEQIEGRTLSIEKARRSRPRTPTPGKYFGPPKRDPRGRYNDRYEDRRGGRGGGYAGGYGREDPYRYRGYDRGGGRYEERGYDKSYDRGYDRGGYREERYERGAGGTGAASGAAGGSGGSGYRDDRTYDRRDRDDGYGSRVDRYGSGRDERGAERGAERGGERGGRYDGRDERRGPAGGYDRDRYERGSDRERPARDAAAGAPGYSEAAPRGESGREPY